MIFRWMLLPNFLDRYGLHRGIVLTGLSWAAMHFHSDSCGGLSVGGVLLHLTDRILLCLVLNYICLDDIAVTFDTSRCRFSRDVELAQYRSESVRICVGPGP